MSDRLSRSNSQSNLPNYGQDKPEDKKNNARTDNQNASAQSDKNASRGNGENKQAKPQMKSKEETKGGKPRENDSGDTRASPDVFGQLFLGVKSKAKEQFDESSSGEESLPSSPRQPQSTAKEKNTNPKVPKLSLQNLGNALKDLASDRREMTVSPRKTRRGTQDDHIGTENGSRSKRTTSATTTSTTTLNASVVPQTFTTTTASSWSPASPRAVSHSTQSSNLQAPRPSEMTTVNSHTTTTSTTTTTTTATLSKSIAKSLQPVEKPASSTPRIPRNLFSGKQKNQKMPDEKQRDTNKKTKVTETKATDSGKTITPTAMASVLTAGARRAIHCAQSGQTPTGAQLAELLICTASNGYSMPIADAMVKTILRGSLVVGNFEDSKDAAIKKDVNIIELVQRALHEGHLEVENIRKFVNELTVEYKTIAQKIPQECEHMDPKTLRKNILFVNLMKPLTDRFIEKFFGKEMKLSSSGFSPEFRNFLSGIDSGVVRWANAIGRVDPNLLFRLRKSAIAAFINTRGIQPIVNATLKGITTGLSPSSGATTNRWDEDKFKSDKLDILNRYLATVINSQIDDFYIDIMLQAENQDSEQKKLVEAHNKAAKLRENEKSRNFSTNDVDKRNPKRAMQLENMRRKEVDTLLKDTGALVFDAQFFHYLKDLVINLNRDEYKKFKENPAGFALEKLNEYVFESGPEYDAERIIEFKHSLDKLIAQQKVRQPETVAVNPVRSGVTTTTVTTPGANITATDSVKETSSAPSKETGFTESTSLHGNDASTESEKSTDGNLTDATSEDDSSSSKQ